MSKQTEELADYQKRELAQASIDRIIVDIKERDQEWEKQGESHRVSEIDDLRGLELAKDLIESDDHNYLAGLDDGKDLARNEIKTHIKIEEVGLFATPKSIKEVEDFIDGLPKDQKTAANVIMGMTWNTCSAIVKRQVEKVTL